MDPLIGAGLISGLGSLATGLLNNTVGQANSKELMRYQAELQQQAIDRQNQYNSPAEQMKRLQVAGLNPNLVYGHGVDGNQSSAASPSMSNRSGQFENPLQDAGQLYLQSQQLQMERIRQRNEAFESRARRLNLEAKTLGVLADNKLKSATMESNIKQAAQNLINAQRQEDILAQKANNMRIEANNLVETTKLLAARTGLTMHQAATEVVKRQMMNSNIHLNNAKINQIAHIIPYIDAGTDLRELAHDRQSLDYAVERIYKEFLRDHPDLQMTREVISDALDKLAKISGMAAPYIVP